MRQTSLLLVLVFSSVVAEAADWPTYMHDNHRSGVTSETLTFPLHVQWTYKSRHAPAPAWPLPAKQNFWANKFNLKARVIYDRAHHLVAAGDLLFFGTSANDQLICLDARTGQTQWRFFAEGPIRLAPTITADSILFGSDDGFVYCLALTDGKLRWKFRLGPTDRQIPGNERVISPWPVRTGVLVDGKTAYFAAGIFPSQGVFQAAVDITTGKKLASGPLKVSAQGYLHRKNGRLFIKTGRNPRGTQTTKLTEGPPAAKKKLLAPKNKRLLTVIQAGQVRIGGGDGIVTAWDNKEKEVWSVKVQGKAYSVVCANQRLFVSTDQGLVYCLSSQQPAGPGTLQPRKQTFRFASPQQRKQTSELAKQILARTQTHRGYCLILNSGDGRLAYELSRQSKLQIVCVEDNDQLVRQSRLHFDSAGLYGRRISVHQRDLSRPLPYTSYLFNLVIDNSGGKSSAAEVARVVRPHGGVQVNLSKGRVTVKQRGPLAGAGDWSHMYANPANTVCSSDELVGGKLHLQWFGRPGPRQMVDRHNRTIAPVTKNGRLFIPGNNRIIAVDSYNGTALWNEPVANSRRLGAYRDASNLVATNERVYVAAADKCIAFDAQTGKRTLTIPVPSNPKLPQQRRHWGFVAADGNLLFGSATQPGASRSKHSKATIREVYYDFGTVVGSQAVFAIDRTTGTKKWSYESPAGMILNPTFTVGDKRMYFVQSSNKNSLLTKDGRATMKDLVANGSELVALDKQTGDVVWRRDIHLNNIQHNVYVSYAQGLTIVTGSRNAGKKRGSRVIYEIKVVDAATGKPKWQQTQRQGTRIGGSHGEQDHHPVVVGNKLYCEPFAYNLLTGKQLKDFRWRNRHRRGCGTISASNRTLFFRDHTLTMFDLTKNQYSKVSQSTRAGCWINMLPAGGLLLVPEASSGCTCNFAIQTSLAFIPVTNSITSDE